MSLLYGNGDFGKSLEIATRSGQDADCNPSSVGGILGTLLGYSKIPDYWKSGLQGAEDIDFKYTTISLNRVYDIGFKHALDNIKRNGGKVASNKVTIPVQAPKAVRFEKSFPDMYPVAVENIKGNIKKDFSFDFEGTGFILRGEAKKKSDIDKDYVFEAELYLDGKKIETAKLPTDFTTRRLELFWKYPLPKGKHTVKITILNPNKNYYVRGISYVVFSDKPAKK